MARGGNVRVSITGNADGLKKATRDSEGALNRLGKSGSLTGRALRDIGHGAAYALGAGGFGGGMYALFDVTKKSIGEFRESQEVSRQTSAALKSTGRAAGISAKQVADLAASLSKKTAIDDEAIQSGENLLLTFTNVRNEVGKGNDIFNQATTSVLDMSVALKQDFKSSAIQLGKALNDPIKGITALQRVGVAFTEDQKKQIKTLVEHGDRLKAQKIILAELTKEFGGSAQKQATPWKQLNVTLGNVAETLGAKLAPSIDRAAKKANVFIQQMLDGKGAGGRFADQMRDVARDVGEVVGVVVDVAKWLGKHPALLKAAGAAWVTYKTVALVQLAIAKAAMFGMFGGAARTKLVGEAGKTGTLTGRSFAAKAGAAAAAGIAGWEIGKWLRSNSGAVQSAGNAIGKQLGEAIFGGSDLQSKVDALIDQAAGLSGRSALGDAVGSVGKKGTKALGNATNPKAPGHRRGNKNKPAVVTKPNAGKSSVRAASSSLGGPLARASGGSVTGDTGGLNADFLNRLHNMSAGTGIPISITSGFRSAAEQQALVNQKGIWSPSNPQGAAPVGSSMHEKGLAADISPGQGSFGGVAARYGLAFTVPGEPWHIQPVGAASGGSTAPVTGGSGNTTPVVVAAPKPKDYSRQTASALRRATGLAGSQTKRNVAALKQHRSNLATSRAARTVNRTLENPWLQARLTHVDNQVAAGELTEAEGNAQRVQILTNALNAPKGLVGEDRLVAQGMIRGFGPQPSDSPLQGQAGGSYGRDEAIENLVEAQNAAAEAARQQTEALNALRLEMEAVKKNSQSILSTSYGVAVKALADLISGQIGGYAGAGGRALTAGAGSNYRF